jgi:hypothetical protein
LTEISHTANITSMALSTQEQVRDTAMMYIQAYHNETTPYMQKVWSGGRTTPEGLVGAETYTYVNAGSAGWLVTIQYPVVLNPIYTVNATYSSPANVGNPITWQGTLQNGTVTETAYTFSS